jgi:hypothetical protein
MFKVGQRVWVKPSKQFGKVEEYRVLGQYIVDGSNFHFRDLHETADDMFERLGYERDNDAPYGFISYSKILKNGDKHYVTFRLEEKQYVIGLMIPKVPNAFVDWADTQHHNAIHQKLIELGWIE